MLSEQIKSSACETTTCDKGSTALLLCSKYVLEVPYNNVVVLYFIYLFLIVFNQAYEQIIIKPTRIFREFVSSTAAAINYRINVQLFELKCGSASVPTISIFKTDESYKRSSLSSRFSTLA